MSSLTEHGKMCVYLTIRLRVQEPAREMTTRPVANWRERQLTANKITG